MSIKKCKSCGANIPENSLYCLKCGSKTEYEIISDSESDIDISQTKKYTIKQKIGIAIGGIIFVIILFFLWQIYLITVTKNAYDIGDYETAYKNLDSIINEDSISDYRNKIDVMYHIYSNYYYWGDDKYDESSYDFAEAYGLYTLCSCIGYSKIARESGCETEVNTIATEVAQWFANKGVDVRSELINIYNNSKSEFYPLLIDSTDDVILSEIDRISKMISSEDAQKAQNESNPIGVTQKDVYKDGDYYYCTGTVSNVSSTTHSFVKVKVTYFDQNESVLTTDWVYAVDSIGIEPGENQQFEIMTSVDGNVDTYKVEVIDYD